MVRPLETFARRRVGPGGVILATVRDERALERLVTGGAEPGDPFDMAVGGFTGPSGGEPIAVQGTLRYLGPRWGYDHMAAVEFGDGNLLVLTPAYTQVTTPESLRFGPIDPDRHDVFVVKSRVRFRRGFDETGYAETILVVDAPGTFIRTTRLDSLDYRHRHAPLDRLYPFGEPAPEEMPGS